MTESQAATTQFCARVMGPLMLIIGSTVIARGDDLALIIPDIVGNAPLSFTTGMFTLILGMVLFVAHHHWSSPVAIVISLLGALTIVRGIVLLFSPSFLAALANAATGGGAVGVMIFGAIALLIGAWLTFAGWFAKRPA